MSRVKRTSRETLARAVSERDFMESVIEYAELLEWLVFRVHDSRRSPEGWPDLSMARDDRLLFAELKRVSEKPTGHQRVWLTTLVSTGRCEVHIWTPLDWPLIEERLR